MFLLWFTEQQQQPPREPADVLTLFPWEVIHAGLSRLLILPGSLLISTVVAVAWVTSSPGSSDSWTYEAGRQNQVLKPREEGHWWQILEDSSPATKTRDIYYQQGDLVIRPHSEPKPRRVRRILKLTQIY